MFEPTEREVDQDVEKSMEMFQRAKVGEVQPLEPRRPEKLLLVLDGSSQDEMGAAVAGRLRTRCGAALAVMDGREGVESNELAEGVARSLDADLIDKQPGDSYDQILAQVDATGCELVVVPSPFGRDLEKVGSDSTGTVIDVLLSRSPVPLLVVRRTFVLEDEPFARVSLVVIGESEAAQQAAVWAVALVAGGGELELSLELPREVLENVRELMHSLEPKREIAPEQVEQVMQRSCVRLHRGLQLAAGDVGFRYQLAVRHLEGASDFESFDEQQSQPLLVLALDRHDPASEGRAHDRIRRSPFAVLVVPVDSRR